MTQRVLLGSGGFRTEQRREKLVEEMQRHFGSVSRILFVPYALADHNRYVRLLVDNGFDAGYEIDGIHTHDDPVRAVREAEAIYVGGGNTFRLLAGMQSAGLLEAIRERVAEGMPYMGVSAGTNVACPTMQTTNDMPITMPDSFTALGLVPFQINAHYFSGQTFVKQGEEFHEHFGETRDDRLREFHEMNDRLVIGLWEGGFLRVSDQGVELAGSAARLFRKGQDSVDLSDGTRLGLDGMPLSATV